MSKIRYLDSFYTPAQVLHENLERSNEFMEVIILAIDKDRNVHFDCSQAKLADLCLMKSFLDWFVMTNFEQ
jgi:hypothetical protein